MDSSIKKAQLMMPKSRLFMLALISLMIINLKIESIFIQLVYLVLAILLTMYDIKCGFSLYFVCSYSNKYFKRSIGDYTQSILVIILFLTMAFKCKGKIRLKYILGAALILISIFISYIGAFYQKDTAALLSIAMDIIVMIVAQNIFRDYCTTQDVLDDILISSGIIGVFLSLKLLLTPVYFGNNGSYQYISIASDINPNTLAQMLVQSFAISLYSLVYEDMIKVKRMRGVRWASIVIMLVAIIRGGSRGALIACLSSLLFIGLINKIVYKKSAKTVVSIFFGGLMVLALFSVVIARNPFLAERFTYDNLMESGGGSRLLAIQTLFKNVIPNHLWFGVGLGSANESAAILQFITYRSGSTNMYVALIAELGIIGAALFYIYFIRITMESIKTLHSLPNYYIVIFTCMVLTTCVHGISEVIFYERYFWNNYIMLICSLLIAKDSLNPEFYREGGNVIK